MGMEITDFADPEIQDSLKYLLVPTSERIRLQGKAFNGAKQCWIPDHKEGFVEGEIQATKGELITVKTSKGETADFKKDEVQQMNPPKYEKAEDMADLTYLNDASVLHNLRQRYMTWMIYVSVFFFNMETKNLFFIFYIDILRSLLRGHQSIQALTRLHHEDD